MTHICSPSSAARCSHKTLKVHPATPHSPRSCLKQTPNDPHRHIRTPGHRARYLLPHTVRMISMVRTVRLRNEHNNFLYDKNVDWGKHFPAANGSRQSPIDFLSGVTQYDSALTDNPLNINYSTSRETDILNNGQNLVIYPKYKGAISGGPLPSGQEFELAEIRLHWGSTNSVGSEHLVNGKAFPMEVQFLHWNASRYASMEEALDKPDGIAAICIFVQIGRENATIKSVINDSLGDVIFKGRQKTTNIPFNPVCLLPDPELRDFWTYEGSLTFPPCHENTTWVLFRYPLLVSPDQIEEFRRLLCYSKGEALVKGSDGRLVDNFRPVQPLNGRRVRASFR